MKQIWLCKATNQRLPWLGHACDRIYTDRTRSAVQARASIPYYASLCSPKEGQKLEWNNASRHDKELHTGLHMDGSGPPSGTVPNVNLARSCGGSDGMEDL